MRRECSLSPFLFHIVLEIDLYLLSTLILLSRATQNYSSLSCGSSLNIEESHLVLSSPVFSRHIKPLDFLQPCHSSVPSLFDSWNSLLKRSFCGSVLNLKLTQNKQELPACCGPSRANQGSMSSCREIIHQHRFNKPLYTRQQRLSLLSGNQTHSEQKRPTLNSTILGENPSRRLLKGIQVNPVWWPPRAVSSTRGSGTRQR